MSDFESVTHWMLFIFYFSNSLVRLCINGFLIYIGHMFLKPLKLKKPKQSIIFFLLLHSLYVSSLFFLQKIYLWWKSSEANEEAKATSTYVFYKESMKTFTIGCWIFKWRSVDFKWFIRHTWSVWIRTEVSLMERFFLVARFFYQHCCAHVRYRPYGT